MIVLTTNGMNNIQGGIIDFTIRIFSYSMRFNGRARSSASHHTLSFRNDVWNLYSALYALQRLQRAFRNANILICSNVVLQYFSFTTPWRRMTPFRVIHNASH